MQQKERVELLEAVAEMIEARGEGWRGRRNHYSNVHAEECAAVARLVRNFDPQIR